MISLLLVHLLQAWIDVIKDLRPVFRICAWDHVFIIIFKLVFFGLDLTGIGVGVSVGVKVHLLAKLVLFHSSVDVVSAKRVSVYFVLDVLVGTAHLPDV